MQLNMTLPETQFRAKPFLKWAGGKTQLLPQYDYYLPESFGTYHEACLGGGAVYFHLQNQKTGLRVRLSDINEELIDCYRAVRDHLPLVKNYLLRHKQLHTKDYYYGVLSLETWNLDLPEGAARFIYLNCTCFNGLYRVNQKGQFNTPIGDYKNPAILDEQKLTSASEALREAEVLVMDFRELPGLTSRGDFVYLDPPYFPLSPTSNFTGYTPGSFSAKDQTDLAQTFRELNQAGALLMLSNSDTPFVRSLYEGFRVETIDARRAINSAASKRGKVSEVLVLNY